MQIKLFASLRLPGANQVTVRIEPGATVADALAELFKLAPHLREQILNPDTGELQPFVNVMLRGRLVRDLQGLQTPVADDDTLAVFPPVAGG